MVEPEHELVESSPPQRRISDTNSGGGFSGSNGDDDSTTTSKSPTAIHERLQALVGQLFVDCMSCSSICGCLSVFHRLLSLVVVVLMLFHNFLMVSPLA